MFLIGAPRRQRWADLFESAELAPGQSGLHSENLSQKNKLYEVRLNERSTTLMRVMKNIDLLLHTLDLTQVGSYIRFWLCCLLLNIIFLWAESTAGKKSGMRHRRDQGQSTTHKSKLQPLKTNTWGLSPSSVIRSLMWQRRLAWPLSFISAWLRLKEEGDPSGF